jgi:hypothetical protein
MSQHTHSFCGRALIAAVFMIILSASAFSRRSQWPSGNAEKSAPNRDLSGLWMDGKRYVVIEESGSSITAWYVDEYICNYAGQQTKTDLQAVLKGDELRGTTTVCEGEHSPALHPPGYVYRSGLQLAPVHLNVNSDGGWLNGTYFRSTDNQEYSIRLVRQDEKQLINSAKQMLSDADRACEAAGPNRACVTLPNWDEIQSKRSRARAAIDAVCAIDPQNAQAIGLLRHVDPVLGDAQAALAHLAKAIELGASRSDVGVLDVQLREAADRIEMEDPSAYNDAERYREQANQLWATFAKTLETVKDVCAGCPILNLPALAQEFETPRLLGAGDYSLDELKAMEENPASQKPPSGPLVTGEFTPGAQKDVALVARGKQKGKDRLFVLIASIEHSRYRRILLEPLE